MSETAPAPAAPVWTCEFAPSAGRAATALDALTVGAPFTWTCHGDIAVQWEAGKPVQLVFPKPEDQYALAILKVLRQDANDVQLEVTGYKAGEHKPAFVRVMQGERGFEAHEPTWRVQSVLDPKQQQPQAYASFGPWNLSLPVWFSVMLALIAIALVYGVIRFMRKRTQRRRMLEDLKRHATALLPLHEFYRDSRQLRRRLHDIGGTVDLAALSRDLNRDFRLFILRQFKVPALDWSDAEILRDLRRRHRKVFKENSETLRRTLRELAQLQKRASLARQDFEQMLRMSLQTAEKIERARAGGRP